MSQIDEVIMMHPDLPSVILCPAGAYATNQYDVGGGFPDKKLSVVIKRGAGTLAQISTLRRELLRTKIPAVFTFELDNGDKMRGEVSDIKITHVRKYSAKLDLYGNKFVKI